MLVLTHRNRSNTEIYSCMFNGIDHKVDYSVQFLLSMLIFFCLCNETHKAIKKRFLDRFVFNSNCFGNLHIQDNIVCMAYLCWLMNEFR